MVAGSSSETRYHKIIEQQKENGIPTVRFRSISCIPNTNALRYGAPQNPSRVLPGDLCRHHYRPGRLERYIILLEHLFDLACCSLIVLLVSVTDTSSPLGVLNLIFFHRYFPSIRPTTFDVLDFTLPAINDEDLETLIESRISALVRQHSSSAASAHEGGGGVRGRIAVEFYEKKRRRSGIWFGGLAGKGEEEVCWEVWNLDVTIATPRTESGMHLAP